MVRVKFLPMKNSVILFTIFFSLFSATLFAQTGSALEFEQTVHDFGEMEQSKPQDYIFKFKNSSTQPISLTMVKASCGCTTPSYTREPIGAGKTGEIKVQYNAAKVGDFTKTVRVEYDSLMDKAVTLTIKGTVKAKPGEEANLVMNLPGSVQTPAVVYSIPRGALAFEKMIENLQEITSENSGTIDFRFKNVSDKVVNILDHIMNDPEISVLVKDKVLQPGQESSISVTVDGRKMKAGNATNGYFSRRLSIRTDEAQDADKSMTVNGTYTRIISQAEKAAAPKITFETIEVNGGQVIEGENWVYDFRFTNTGKSPLVIESAKASCGCTATTPPVGQIMPGQSSAITASFNSAGRVGLQSKTITVTSNDIENPILTLKFNVEVIKDPFHSGGMLQTNQ
jgi:Protein of unknown function (DUF1573)